MRLLEDREFRSGDFRDYNSAAVYCDVSFRRCIFQGCTVSVTRDPAFRSTVRNIQLINCSQRGSSVHCPIVEDVVVDGFNTNGQLFIVSGAVFNRVVLRGKIDRLMITNDVLPLMTVSKEDRHREMLAFRAANAGYYRNVEWALDIREASFNELDLRGVSGHLVRRDPETQVLVTREKVLEGRWKQLELHEGMLWAITFSMFLETDAPSTVLVAAKRHRNFRARLADLQTLRKAGVAEPD